jgi:type IV pilus assembly protein PilQ
MKKGIFLPLITTLLLFTTTLFSAELKSIDFKQVDETTQLIMSFDTEDVKANKFAHNKQIIIDLKNVNVDSRVSRAFDTSEFSGSVVYVRALPRNKKDLRVSLQLRENVRSVLKREGNRVILSIENRFGVFSQSEVDVNKIMDERNINTSLGKVHIPKSASIEDILENLTHSGRKKYIGKKISLNVRDLPVQDILTMIADSSGFNIILTSEIKELKPLTLNLTNIPWDQSLDTILGLNKLVAKKNGVILLITTLEKATAERKFEIEANKLAEQEEPLVTRIFPISYAKIADMNKIMNDYLTPVRGKISLDERTNSIIVKDTPEVIEKVVELVKLLDTQTPQVLIESKIVEVSENYTKMIGLQNGLNFGYDPVGSVSTDVGPGFNFSSAPSSGTSGRSLFGMTVGRLDRLLNLEFALQMMESESKGKIVASPKVITQNKKTAELNTKDTTSFAKATETESGGSLFEFEEISVELKMKVTPQVTNEGSIVLEVDISKEHFGGRPEGSSFAPPDKAKREVKTNVLVDNGSTIVIGGIYSYENTESHSGVPYLKDIPLIGWLFRTPFNPATRKRELVIFLTPRIINQEEAGLSEMGQES